MADIERKIVYIKIPAAIKMKNRGFTSIVPELIEAQVDVQRDEAIFNARQGIDDLFGTTVLQFDSLQINDQSLEILQLLDGRNQEVDRLLVEFGTSKVDVQVSEVGEHFE